MLKPNEPRRGRSAARREGRAGPWVLAMAATALTTLAACGGSESGDGFAAEADAICTDSTREQAEIAKSGGSAGDFAATAADMSKLAESGTTSVEQMQALDAPPDGEKWDAYLENRRRAIAIVERRGAAAEREDKDGVDEAATDLNELLVERDALAEQLGLQACARILPDQDEEQVREAVELASTSGDGKRVCEEVVAATYIDRTFGGSVERCARVQSRAQPSKSVEFRDVYGVAGVLATAEVQLNGGALDGKSATLQLIYEDGAYRIFQASTTSSAA